MGQRTQGHLECALLSVECHACTQNREVNMRAAKGSFRRKYPQAARLVTTYREMEALDLQIGNGWDTDFVANTSQNVNQMPIADENKPIMCLTSLSQLVWTCIHKRKRTKSFFTLQFVVAESQWVLPINKPTAVLGRQRHLTAHGDSTASV